MSKGISAEKIAIIKERSESGALPQEIAGELSIAVSTVHHHKALLKKQGAKFPDMRGSRPQASNELVATYSKPTRSLIVNGAKFIITGAPIVIISSDKVEVTYPSSQEIEK